MNVQWSLLILLFLGLVAATSAALLVGFMRVNPAQEIAELANRDTTVLTAVRDIPAMTVLDESMLEKVTVAIEKVPEGALAEPVQAIGRIVGVSVTKGQAFTEQVLIPEGTGYQLAGLLPEGWRAVTISLAQDSGMAELLYPGSRVDALATFPLSNNETGTAVSTTLLENVEVLAVESITVAAVKGGADEEKPATGAPPRRATMMVTLMVNPEQAKAIQLACDFGNVSLAMRNPLDPQTDPSDVQVLSEGQLARFGDLLSGKTGQEEAPAEDRADASPPPPISPALPVEPDPASMTPPPARETTINVLRGTIAEIVSFSE